jgi:hypothetical protein
MSVFGKIFYVLLFCIAITFSQPLRVALIGDSISLELKPYLPFYVNGKVGRQFYSVFSVLKHMDINRYDVFVIELGTNGYVKPSDLKRLINMLHNKKIYLCTIQLPNKYIWKHEVNTLYFQTSKKYSNVKIIDWYNFSKHHPSFFIRDGVHLTRLGAKAYSKLIIDKVLK